MRSIFSRLQTRFGPRISSSQRRSHVQTKIAGLQGRFAQMDAPFASRAVEADATRPRVIVIGAGFAGLMAAYSLRGHCEVTVFEARDRVGGRVWSKATSSGIIEAGGELIGYDHPLWLQLAATFDLGFSVLSTETAYDALHLELPLYLDGSRLSEPARARWN